MGRRRLLPRALLALLLSTGVASGSPSRPSLVNEIQTEILFVKTAQLVVDEFAVPGNERAPLLAPLERYARTHGSPVSYIPLTESLFNLGMTVCQTTPRHGRRCIVLIDEGLSVNSRVGTLLHELAHVKHWSKRTTTLEAEVIAETTAFLAMKELGYDSRRESMSYLMGIPEELRDAALRKWEKEIRQWATELVKAARAND